MLKKLENYIMTNFRGCVLINKNSCYEKMQETISFSEIEHNAVSENTDLVCVKFGKQRCCFNFVWEVLDPTAKTKRVKLVRVIPLKEQIGSDDFRNRLVDMITEARASGTSTTELVDKYAESLLVSGEKC